MNFEFVAPKRIIFGEGSVNKVKSIIPQMGKNALVVTGSGKVPINPLRKLLDDMDINYHIYRVHKEPDVHAIEAGILQSKSKKCDFIIAYGGGAVLDEGKTISALMTNHGDLLTYLEVVGEGNKIKNEAAPMIALPTTAGTGTEVTKNAVIISPEHHVKVSMRSPLMIPRVAIVDPVLTYTMPPSITASTGLDALTQVIEAYVSNKANPMTDSISREGIQRGAKFLQAAYKNGQDKIARENMSLTSLFGGLALANSGLGAVHGFAGVIGGMYDAPHGEICACLLPYVMKYNIKALSLSLSKTNIYDRYKEIAVWLTGDQDATITDGVKWIENLVKELNMPNLQTIGIKQDDFTLIIQRAKISSSMQKNPIELKDAALGSILREAY
ncbi:MAG: iron-containing alcohol dehydrogenase [Anaerolineales bacterium]